MAVTWSQASRISKIFINGSEVASKSANTGLSNYEIMSNSHQHYQVGSKKDSPETFYGFVRDLKVFKRLLNDNEIKQQAGTICYSEYHLTLSGKRKGYYQLLLVT